MNAFGGCTRAQELLDLYVDGELADLERGEFEAHMARCPDCASNLERAQRLKRDLRGSASAFVLSPTFHQRFAGALASTPAPRTVERRVLSRQAIMTALAAAGLVALAVPAVASLERANDEATPAGQVAGVSDLHDPIVQQSLRWHRRQVPVEVTGPNASAVQNWFATKVDFPVRVPDFGRRAHLLGGRLGNVDAAAAAVLIYDVGGRKLSVLAFDAAPFSDDELRAVPRDSRTHGYSVVVHRRGPVGYSFTADLEPAELDELVAAAMDGVPF